MWTKTFWLHTAERAAKTAAQTALATIGATATLSQINWALVISAAGAATLLSVLTSVASCGVGDRDSPNLVPNED